MEYSWEEIRKHDNADSCWLVVNDKVYDVTPFLKLHPAKDTPILRKAGQDVTVDFNFHSHKAKSMWKEYCIGKVKKNPYKKKGICTIM